MKQKPKHSSANTKRHVYMKKLLACCEKRPKPNWRESEFRRSNRKARSRYNRSYKRCVSVVRDFDGSSKLRVIGALEDLIMFLMGSLICNGACWRANAQGKFEFGETTKFHVGITHVFVSFVIQIKLERFDPLESSPESLL